MSAEVLREAARLMRERASSARAGIWYAVGSEVLAEWQDEDRYIGVCDGSLPGGNKINATHIASWHPAVALAVADWLDEVASKGQAFPKHHAIALARAYLGDPS